MRYLGLSIFYKSLIVNEASFLHINKRRNQISSFTWPLKDDWSYKKYKEAIENSILKPLELPSEYIIEDPFLISSDNSSKRTCELAYKFGKNSAQSFISKHKDYIGFRSSNPSFPSQDLSESVDDSIHKAFIIEKLISTETIYEAMSVAINACERENFVVPEILLIKMIDCFFFTNKKNKKNTDHDEIDEKPQEFFYADKLFNLVENKSSMLYEIYIIGLLNNESYEKATEIYKEMHSINKFGTSLLYSTYLRSLANIHFDDKILITKLKEAMDEIKKYPIVRDSSIISAFVYSLPYNNKESESILYSIIKDFALTKAAIPLDLIGNASKIIQTNNKNYFDVLNQLIFLMEQKFPVINLHSNETKGILDIFKLSYKRKSYTTSTNLMNLIDKWGLWTHLSSYSDSIVSTYLDLMVASNENPTKIVCYIQNLKNKVNLGMINFIKIIEYIEKSKDVAILLKLIEVIFENYPQKSNIYSDKLIIVLYNLLNEKNCLECTQIALKYLLTKKFVGSKTFNHSSESNNSILDQIDLGSIGVNTANFLLTSFALSDNRYNYHLLHKYVQNKFTPEMKCYISGILMEARTKNLEYFKNALEFVGSNKTKQIHNNISLALNSSMVLPQLNDDQKEILKKFLTKYDSSTKTMK